MKKFLIFLIFVLFSCTNIQSDLPFIISNQLTLEQYTDSFDIITDKGKIGKIKKMFDRNIIKMFDNKNNIIAYVKKDVYVGITKVTFFDENDNKIGYLEETAVSNVFSPYAVYNIYDKDKKLIAMSDKIQLGQTSLFHINDLNGKCLCTYNKPKISMLSANWKIVITNDNIDKKIFLLIPAYKTTRD